MSICDVHNLPVLCGTVLFCVSEMSTVWTAFGLKWMYTKVLVCSNSECFIHEHNKLTYAEMRNDHLQVWIPKWDEGDITSSLRWRLWVSKILVEIINELNDRQIQVFISKWHHPFSSFPSCFLSTWHGVLFF